MLLLIVPLLRLCVAFFLLSGLGLCGESKTTKQVTVLHYS